MTDQNTVYEFNQRKYDELHGREFAEAHISKINAQGNKEHKEAIYCFARGLNLIENIEKNMPAKLKKIGLRFSKESDKMLKLSDDINHGKLGNMNNKELVDLHNKFVLRDLRLYNIAQKYSKFIGDEEYTPPNYEKYLCLSRDISYLLSTEIDMRDGEI